MPVVGLWTGCVSGALLDVDYLTKLAAAGFANPSIQVTRTYTRTTARGAAGLLRRQRGLQTILTDVELLPAPWLTLLDAVKVKGDQAPNARIWAVDLPLGPGPMRLTMRTTED